jgi:hypothetical protein
MTWSQWVWLWIWSKGQPMRIFTDLQIIWSLQSFTNHMWVYSILIKSCFGMFIFVTSHEPISYLINQRTMDVSKLDTYMWLLPSKYKKMHWKYGSRCTKITLWSDCVQICLTASTGSQECVVCGLLLSLDMFAGLINASQLDNIYKNMFCLARVMLTMFSNPFRIACWLVNYSS